MKKKQNLIFETMEYEAEALFSFMHNYKTEHYPNHWHNAVEIVMPLENTYKVVMPDSEYNLEEYDILIIPSGDQHEMCAPSTRGQRIILQFDLAILNSVRGFINASYIYAKQQFITPSNAPELHERLKTLLLEMLDENKNQFTYYEVSIIIKIVELTVQLARKQHIEYPLEYENLSKRKEYIAKFNYCVEYIKNNYKENLTLDSVSHAVDFSKYHFIRWFKQYANMSFTDYLTRVRIDKAEAMLVSTSKPVTEIAMEAGFQSIPTFNRIFKKYKKCTPTEYRNFYYINEDNQLNNFFLSENKEDSNIKNENPIISRPIPADFIDVNANKKINGDRTILNPFLGTEVPDSNVICVGGVYYTIGITMCFMPGCPVMKSIDLVNWEIANYVYDILEDSDALSLRNGTNSYGKDSSIGCLRYHNGIFYVVVVSFSTGKTYIFQTEDIEHGAWCRYTLDGVYHNMSLLFDDDGRIYLIYGSETIRVIELNADVTDVKEGGLDCVIVEKADVGKDGGLQAKSTHFYKMNGKYYVFQTSWLQTGLGRRILFCYRADNVEGPYDDKSALGDENSLEQDLYAHSDLPTVGFVKSTVISDEFYLGVEKKYAAVNDTSYRYSHMKENGLHTSDALFDVELVINGNYEDGVANWYGSDIANITPVIDIDGEKVLLVSNRTTTSSGPEQDITGKVEPGGVYIVQASVRYSSGPAYKDFNICICNGSSWEGIQIMGSGHIPIGEWGVVKGTYTLPMDADLSKTTIFVETCWFDKPKKDTDLMDFYVKNVSVIAKSMPYSDGTEDGENDSNGSSLAQGWQWYHNPDNNLWSLTERPSFLRLKTGYLSIDMISARNTLTQSAFEPECSSSVAVDISAMKDGDVTGLAAFQDNYGYVGVKMVNDTKYVVMVNATYNGNPQEVESILLTQEKIYLKVDFDFNDKSDKACFYYSLDEIYWHAIGNALPMKPLTSHFAGYRIAIFYYATQIVGGHVDFDYFRACGSLTRNDDSVQVLNASFGGDREICGVCGEKVEISVNMDALPDCTEYKGIYISIPVPENLEVSSVDFCGDNISGDAAYCLEGKRLMLSVTGEFVSFANKSSDLFAKIKFNVVGFVQEDSAVTLQPDYIYVDGGNVAYDIHDMTTQIKLTALVSLAKAKIPGRANPLISHKYGADPWALEYNGRIYIYLTGDKYGYNEFGRLDDNIYSKINTISVISSADLINWTDHGEIAVAGLKGAAKWAKHSWAPAVAVKNVDGKDSFFLYFANDASNIGVLSADSPIGPWTDPIGKPLIHRKIPGVADVKWCFDPAVLIDDDGSAYLYFGGGLPSDLPEDALHPRTARVIKLGSDMISTEGEAVMIDAPALFEDSGINKYNGKYYYSYCSNFIHPLTVSNNLENSGEEPTPISCQKGVGFHSPVSNGYPPHGAIAYMISDYPMGPFTYVGTILKNPEHFFGVRGNNHHCIFKFNGMWYIAYHAQTLGKALNKVKGYRSPHINKLEFFENGHICPVAADMTGVTTSSALNPYEQTSAATIAWCAGISTVSSKDMSFPVEGMYVTDIHDGDWLAVANADFGETGATRFSAMVASHVGGAIEIRLDSPLGDVVGTLGVGSTNTEDIWELKSWDIKKITGTHNLFFIFSGDSEQELFNFGYWLFS